MDNRGHPEEYEMDDEPVTTSALTIGIPLGVVLFLAIVAALAAF
jgi:hypothetical protein